MEHIDVDEVEDEPHVMGVNSTRRPLAAETEEMTFAMTYFELDPGEAFGGGPHTHHDQAEAFYVREGIATFRVRDGPEDDGETLEVGPNEVVHFEAGDAFQHGYNASDEAVVGIALGVPGPRHDPAEIEALVPCPECGRETSHGVEYADGGIVGICNDCGDRH